MANVKFSYLYRDAGNYKIFGEIIFANIDEIDFNLMDQKVRSKLIDGLWFYPKQWGLPSLHFHKWDEELDHEFHEFEQLAPTEMEANIYTSLTAFYDLVLKTNWK